VLICQNNQWAISASVAQQSRVTDLYKKADAYGIPGVQVDGNDVVAVYLATKAALKTARVGKGPTLLELVTYRAGAHSTSDDPSVYRDEAAGKAWFLTHDPLPRAIERCRDRGLFEDGELDASLAAFERELDLAIAACEAAGPPPREDLFADVYGQPPWHLREQSRQLASERG
jgi:TPP-dependent pyruvate/acetoin dehydrogenase alpha subunit